VKRPDGVPSSADEFGQLIVRTCKAIMCYELSPVEAGQQGNAAGDTKNLERLRENGSLGLITGNAG
jgi:hypothetical protein